MKAETAIGRAIDAEEPVLAKVYEYTICKDVNDLLPRGYRAYLLDDGMVAIWDGSNHVLLADVDVALDGWELAVEALQMAAANMVSVH